MTLRNPMIEWEASIEPADKGGFAIVRSEGTQRSIRLDSLADFLFLRMAFQASYDAGRDEAAAEIGAKVLAALQDFD